jgi:predicted XRE-type DNA-binding protein/phage-related protein
MSEMGYALGPAQLGGMHPSAKPWKREGSRVLEFVESHDGNAFRAAFRVRFKEVAYVLHAFQKKSHKGISTARADVEFVTRRADRRAEGLTRHDMTRRSGEGRDKIARGNDNLFVDLGFADADERQTKLRLALAINQLVGERGLTQARSAKLLGINQPKISTLANYKLDGFSVERLMTFLNALDRDVEIVIKKKPKSRNAAKIIVTAD